MVDFVQKVQKAILTERNSLDIGDCNFRQVDNFIYLISLLNADNQNSSKIKSRITTGKSVFCKQKNSYIAGL